MMQKLYRFCYTNPPGEGRARLHQVRDGDAFNELTAGIYPQGYEYGTYIHNYPHHSLTADHFRFLRPGDLLVMTTRPPLSDYLGDPKHAGEDKDKRHIVPSDNHLEKAIFSDLKRFFVYLSRYRVELTPEMAALLKSEVSKMMPHSPDAMAVIDFHTKGKATIRSTQVMAGGRPRDIRPPPQFNAVGYFLHTRKIPGYPCGMIVSFSMGGYENLLWNRIVRLRHSQWLSTPVFVFALLNLPEEPPQPLTPEIADKVIPKVLIEHWLDVDGVTSERLSLGAPDGELGTRKIAP